MRRAAAAHILVLSLVAASAAELRCTQVVTDPEEGRETRPPCLAQEQFNGSWNWISSCGGIGLQCFTPDSEGLAQRLDLEETGSFEVIVDDTLWTAGRFCILSDESSFVIQYTASIGTWYPRQWISLRGLDTLLLDDGCCDLYSHTFVRAEE